MFALTRYSLLSLAITASLTPLVAMAAANNTASDIEHISVNYKQAYRGDVPLRLQAQAVESLHLEML